MNQNQLMNRNNNFTMIHIMAAIMVIIGHQFVLTGSTPPFILGHDIHGLGVRILFSVSGYLVSTSFIRTNSIKHYLKKRVSRLFPPLILCLLVTIIVLRFVTTSPDAYWKSAVTYFFHNIELRPKFDIVGVFADNPYPIGVNGSLWTLPIEFACYLSLIPVLFIVELLRKKNGIAVARLTLLLLLCTLSGIDIWRVFYTNGITAIFWDTDWFNGVLLSIWFYCGVFAGYLPSRFINWQIGVVAVILHSCLSPSIRYVLMPYIISYLVFSFAFAEKPLFNNTFKRDICYGLYLYAFPVQQLLCHFLLANGNSVPIGVLLIAASIIIWALAEASYYLIEIKFHEFLSLKEHNPNM